MDVSHFLVSRVVMPENGVFTMRVEDDLVSAGVVKAGTKGRFVVLLDYGEDVGTVLETADYDPAVHGVRIPGFRLLRPLDASDAQTLKANAALASTMSEAFFQAARLAVPDLRVPCARLSFGRHRLFLRYLTELRKPDFSAALDELKRRFDVDVNLWAMGPRDEVAEMGALGPCGRVCCCCSWQRRYPSHLTPSDNASLPALLNGICGRFKCCLAFERDAADGAVDAAEANEGKADMISANE